MQFLFPFLLPFHLRMFVVFVLFEINNKIKIEKDEIHEAYVALLERKHGQEFDKILESITALKHGSRKKSTSTRKTPQQFHQIATTLHRKQHLKSDATGALTSSLSSLSSSSPSVISSSDCDHDDKDDDDEGRVVGRQWQRSSKLSASRQRHRALSMSAATTRISRRSRSRQRREKRRSRSFSRSYYSSVKAKRRLQKYYRHGHQKKKAQQLQEHDQQQEIATEENSAHKSMVCSKELQVFFKKYMDEMEFQSFAPPIVCILLYCGEPITLTQLFYATCFLPRRFCSGELFFFLQ